MWIEEVLEVIVVWNDMIQEKLQEDLNLLQNLNVISRLIIPEVKKLLMDGNQLNSICNG